MKKGDTEGYVVFQRRVECEGREYMDEETGCNATKGYNQSEILIADSKVAI